MISQFGPPSRDDAQNLSLPERSALFSQYIFLAELNIMVLPDKSRVVLWQSRKTLGPTGVLQRIRTAAVKGRKLTFTRSPGHKRAKSEDHSV